MKQEVTLKKRYPSSHQQLQIHAVYQKDDHLIVISQILSHPKTSVTCIVNTTADKTLPIDTIIITDHYNPHTIPEVQGLTPLTMHSSSPSQSGIFSNSELNSTKPQTMPPQDPQPKNLANP